MGQGKLKFKWHYLGLAAILFLSIILNFYKLGQEGYGNTYYSAAVKSMMDSWHNFFFNSFDSKGFITIDKPPVGFWFQTLSAYIFGFKGWSLFLPQALAGVLAVALLYHLVARVFGRGAGLLAALFLALTPIVVAADRTNEVDSMLMFVTLIATWAISKAVEKSHLKWLVLAFFLVGVGFNIKMMEAFLVLPAFYLFYLISPKLTWTKKLVHLLVATIVLMVVSLSWSIIVDSVPSDQRPYVGSTQNNSMITLAIGYNGINRLVGQQRGQQGNFHMSPQQGQQFSNWNGSNEVHRKAGSNVQSSMGQPMNSHNPQFMRNMSRNQGNFFSGFGQTGNTGIFRLFTTPELDGQLSWLLPGVLISVISLLWGTRFRVPIERKRQTVVLWTVWVLTMLVFFSIAKRFSSYYMVMMAPGIAALAGAGFKEMWKQWGAKEKKESWFLPLAMVCTVVFEISVVWKYPTLRDPLSITIGVLTIIALICLMFVKKINAPGKRGISIIVMVAGVLALIAAPTAWAMTPIEYGGNVTKPFAGPELKTQHGRDGMTSNPNLENYLKSNYREGTYLVATLNATSAAPIILDTGLPVMAMGGFMGNDPALTVEKLQKLVNEGQIRYFLLQERSFGHQQSAVLNWIKTNCLVVPGYKWQDTPFKPSQNRGRLGFGNSSMTLYEYVKK
ncbi:glycosyltransferase family 39 protein [Neobacillus ginsengisoli]|uniref:4-amino-4-deoxy-L-arabinose transferase-like glycosyltransferase n=1 Tax=Neobacillus ginsengisoli TaxID=904295 RepID=A0ABT9Y1U5_9BACI|nr:glycosyltransferase family 39 protein [Neobacillus ginsengisoli]MDQ0201132.1 4-amino-4-deoxy-L-arabinose transferase-like glycosyltransferase [Neobacillus ginsengisoli]